MTAPTDAVALFRMVLANPGDETPRLVFADWLEETGEPHNIAWAEYLRLNTAGQGQTVQADDLHKLAHRIRARLVVPAAVFELHHLVILDLLPSKNVTVRLGDFTPPRSVTDLIPEALSRSNQMIPLLATRDELFVVSVNRIEWDVIDRVRRRFRHELIQVRGIASEIKECHDRIWGGPETETIDVLMLFGDSDNVVTPNLMNYSRVTSASE